MFQLPAMDLMWWGWDRLEDGSPHVTTNTKELSTAIATLPTMQNPSMKKHTPLAPSTTSCKCYVTTRKEHIWTLSKDLHPRWTCNWQPSEWLPHYLSQQNFWHPNKNQTDPNPHTLGSPDPNTPYISILTKKTSHFELRKCMIAVFQYSLSK